MKRLNFFDKIKESFINTSDKNKPTPTKIQPKKRTAPLSIKGTKPLIES